MNFEITHYVAATRQVLGRYWSDAATAKAARLEAHAALKPKALEESIGVKPVGRGS